MELTNQTYLRSRVDMNLADSLRRKASNKISAGALGNARENAGGFSAGIRFKSNQYLLQTKRANIQNSLSYLEVQRNAIMEGRDIMERIALTKIKFDSPALNATDRKNLNTEFTELTEELISLREKKFNGVSLFTPTSTSSSELYGSSRTNLESGSGADNGVGISQHVIDYQDIRNIYDAGEAVRRGIAGLDVINFEADPVQRQIEKITIGGSIADGDVFELKLNELSSIREVESTHNISVTADAADEAAAIILTDPDGVPNSGDETYDQTPAHTMIRDKLIADINAKAANGKNGQFVTASASGANEILITSEGEGDPFDLFGVTSSGSVGTITETSNTGGVVNDAEERLVSIDFKHDTKNTGIALKVNDTVSVDINGATYTYRVDQTDIDTINGSLGDTTSNPQNYGAAALRVATGLAGAINTATGTNKAWADLADVQNTADGASLMVRSTERGNDLAIAGTGAVSINQAEVLPTATSFQFSLSDPARTLRAGDQFQIEKDGVGVLTFNYDLAAGVTNFSSWNDLATKLQSHPDGWFQTATVAGNTMTVTAAQEDLNVQPNFRARQLQTDDAGSLLANPTFASGTFVKETNWTNVVAQQGNGTGLTLDLTIDNSDGSLSATAVNNAGAGSYQEGDTVRVRGNALDGDFGTHDYVFTVDDVRGTIASFSGAASGQGASTYNYTGIATTAITGTGTGLTVNVVSDADGNIQVPTINAGGTGYANNNRFTIAGSDLNGGSGVNTYKVNVGAGGVVTGLSQVFGGGAQNDIQAKQNNSFTGLSATGGTGTGATFNVGMDSAGLISSLTVANAGTGYGEGDTLTIAAADITGTGGTGAVDVTFTINSLVAGTSQVNSVSYASGTAKMSFSNNNVTATGGAGSGLTLDVTTNRLGAVTAVAVNSNGQNYATGNTVTVDGAQLTDGGGASGTDNLSFTVGAVESDWTELYDTAAGGAQWKSTDPANAAYDAGFGARGLQRIAPPANAGMSDSIVAANAVGTAKVVELTVGNDPAAGQIAAGDQFTVTVTENLHPDETSGAWPENHTGGEGNRNGNPHAFSASVVAAAGETSAQVAARLETALDDARTAYVGGDARIDEDLPTIANVGNVLTLTSQKAGEDFDVALNYVSAADSLTGTGLHDFVTDPKGKFDPGTLSHQKNISPFSITKSTSYFEEMLAQNEAETSRLMKAQEHLENSMIHNETALGKIMDTDYAQASTQHIKGAMQMQMANNVIGKSMRMTDLLVDLTTNHHRGSMLNAKA